MKVVILGSGSGTNAEAILAQQAAGGLEPAQVVAVYCDVDDAPILAKAENHGVPARHLSAEPFRTKLDGEAQEHWIEAIRSDEPDLIVLAGFMRVLKSPFLQAFPNKIINLHPSLLPAFPGLDAIRRAFERGVKITGCTIHWVNEEVDGGEIIAQAPVRTLEGDTLEMLGQRIHAAEHIILPAAIRNLATGAIPPPK